MPPQEQDADTQQHQAEAEEETSLIVKLDFWTVPPQERNERIACSTDHVTNIPALTELNFKFKN